MHHNHFKKFISFTLSVTLALTCIIFPEFSASADESYGTQIAVTRNYQVVDSFCGVDAKYVLGYSDTGDYCCAAYVSNFYKSLFDVTVYGINMWDGMPAVMGDGNPQLREVYDIKPGDIMQTKTYDHVAIVKAVNGDDITLIEQNYKWTYNKTVYTLINRHVIKKNYHFYRLYKNGVEQTIANSNSYGSGQFTQSQGQTLQSIHNTPEITLKKGQSDYLTSTLTSTDNDPVVWQSSNNSSVQVENGKISASDIGTAEISAKNSTGRQSCKVTVTDDISSAKTTVATCYYNGKNIQPDVKLTYCGKTLQNGKDYTVSSAGREIGTAKAVITGKGYFTNSKEISYTIKPPRTSKVKTTAVSSSAVRLSWNAVTGVDGYIVSMYNTNTKKWQRVYKGKSTKLRYAKLKSAKTYKFKVTTYKVSNKKAYYSPNAYVEFTTKPSRALFLGAAAKGNGKVYFSFYSQSGISGREIFASTSGVNGTFKRVKTTSAKACTVKNQGKSKMKYYKVRAYKKVNGKKIYGSFSPVLAVWLT